MGAGNGATGQGLCAVLGPSLPEAPGPMRGSGRGRDCPACAALPGAVTRPSLVCIRLCASPSSGYCVRFGLSGRRSGSSGLCVAGGSPAACWGCRVRRCFSLCQSTRDLFLEVSAALAVCVVRRPERVFHVQRIFISIAKSLSLSKTSLDY